MSGRIEAEVAGGFPGWLQGDFIEEVGAKSAASASHRFAEYLKNHRFDELFNDQTGETKGSIDTYRFKGKKPAYVVKAGVGIPGNLNYLAGLYRGEARSRSGKLFSYARKRDLIIEGWKKWGGDRMLQSASRETLEKMIAEKGGNN
jgi:hypothetical protein